MNPAKPKPKPKPDELNPIDWERVEVDYRAGVLSIREVGKRHGCSHVAILLKAKERGWARDLRAKIKAKTEELLTKQVLTNRLTSSPESEGAIVTANAEGLLGVELLHRDLGNRSVVLMSRQLAEVEAIQTIPELFAQVYDALSIPGERTPEVLLAMAEAVTSLPKRQKMARDAVEGARASVALQRLVLGMDDDQPVPSDPGSYENVVDLAAQALEQHPAAAKLAQLSLVPTKAA